MNNICDLYNNVYESIINLCKDKEVRGLRTDFPGGYKQKVGDNNRTIPHCYGTADKTGEKRIQRTDAEPENKILRLHQHHTQHNV